MKSYVLNNKIINVRKGSRLLKENKINSFPKRILLFDSETKISDTIVKKRTKKPKMIKAEKHSLRLGYFEYWQEINGKYEEIYSGFYYSKNEFYNILIKCFMKEKSNLYIFAHNTSFDFRVSVNLKYLLSANFEITKEIIDSNRFILILKSNKGKNKDRNIIFLDTLNYFKLPLKEIGKIFKLNKVGIENFKTVGEKKLKLRCKKDVLILRKIVFSLLDFLENNNCGNFAYTIAGLCFNTFRHNQKNKIYIHDNIDARKLERESYFGGRTEVFQLGKIKNCYKLDINSMYPYVMKNNVYPTKLIKILKDKNGIDKKIFEKYYYNNNYLIIAKMKIKTDENCIPITKNSKLIFPVGTFTTSLCQPEITLLLNNGGKILKIYELAIYKSEKIFTDYINHFYNLRQKYKRKNNEVYSLFTKIFMNSLYGKFAQKSEYWKRNKNLDELIILCENSNYLDYATPDGKLLQIKFINGEAFVKEGYFDGYNSFIAISSFVTSYARAYLFELIKKARKNGGEVYYVDTDSLFLNLKGYLNLRKEIDDYKLGKLKLEEKGEVEIRGLKDYVFNGEEKIKGVKKGAKQIGKNKFKQQRFSGFKESLRYFDINNVYVFYETKTLKREYNKGKVLKNGKIIPFVLNE